MKRVALMVLLLMGVLGVGADQALATPICIGGGVDPAWVTVCTP